MDLFKWFTDWYGRYQVVQSIVAALKAIFFPVVAAAMTAAAGIIGKSPIMWVIMATTLTLMGGVVAVFFGSLLSDFRTPCNKLRYVNTVLNLDFCEAPNRKTKRANQAITHAGLPQSCLNKAQVGVQLHNTASFPISAFMEFAITKIEGKDPPRSAFPKQAVTIEPGCVVNMTDDVIDLPVTPWKDEWFNGYKNQIWQKRKRTL